MSGQSTIPRRRNRKNKRPTNSRSMVSAMITAERIAHPEPPQYNSSHHYRVRLRWRFTKAVTRYPILSQDIANIMGVVYQDSDGPNYVASQYPIWTRFRLRTVEMWATASSLSVPTTIVVALGDLTSGVANNSEMTKTDTTASIDEYAHVKIVVPKTSIAYQWQSAQTSGGAFALDAPIGAILDIVLDVYLNNGDPFVPFGVVSPFAPTVGALIQNPIDPSGVALSYTVPIGYYNGYDNVTATPRP